jgi:hypothetical protein
MALARSCAMQQQQRRERSFTFGQEQGAGQFAVFGFNPDILFQVGPVSDRHSL